jgi:8-amino-7-oxononanoate synthase
MQHKANTFLEKKLNERKEQNALRFLRFNHSLIDFCSNDYLGFAQSTKLNSYTQEIFDCLETNNINGSTGSRLLAGNTVYVEQLEKKIASFHNTEAGLIFNSGYDANVGLFSSLLQKEDTIIYDELIHASMHDGIRLSKANAFAFKHNDLLHLEERLQIANGVIYVAIESIYSMDGDEALLLDIAALCKKYTANLIVDEAHATGITSNGGKGLVQQYNLENKIFARVHTFGKALGCHGAIVLGSNLLRDYLINFARSFIYTTALPLHSLASIAAAFKLLQESDDTIAVLQKRIAFYKKEIKSNFNILSIESNSAIQTIVVAGNDKVKALATVIQNDGFDVRPILSPTVPKGKERLRICIHSFNTEVEISGFVKSINKHIQS